MFAERIAMVAPRMTSNQATLLVVASFVIASVVNVYPLSFSVASFRPLALMMVLSFWLIARPRHVGISVAFVIGLIADLLLDTQLGEQALAAVIMAFVIQIFGLYVRRLSFWLMWMIAGVALVTFQFSLWLIQYLTQSIFILHSAYALIVSLFLWPLIYLVLHKFVKL